MAGVHRREGGPGLASNPNVRGGHGADAPWRFKIEAETRRQTVGGTQRGRGSGVLAFVPARRGPKRTPANNVGVINRKPLIGYMVKTALRSGVLDRVMLVSLNFAGVEDSAAVDHRWPMVHADAQLKLVAWCDNKLGYGPWVVDLVERLSRLRVE